MNKFTTVKKNEIKKSDEEKKSVIFKGEEIEVIKKEREFLNSKDKIAILPYFIEEGHVYMSIKNVESFEYKLKKNRFINVIEDYIDYSSSLEQNVRTILYNRCGLVLSEFFDIKIEGPFFASRNNTRQYYLTLLEIKYNDYKQTPLKEDSQIIKLDISNINDIIVYDMTSLYLLFKLKNNYKV